MRTSQTIFPRSLLAPLVLLCLAFSLGCGFTPVCPSEKACSETTQDEVFDASEVIRDSEYSEEKESVAEFAPEVDKTPEEPTTEKGLEKEPIPEGECTPGATRTCYDGEKGTSGVGICKQGQQFCSLARLWGPCVGQILPTKESCNNKDDDCNGKIDDSFPEQGQDCRIQNPSPCDDGVFVCEPVKLLYCKPKAASNPELCNGKDDNCDGKVDDVYPEKGKTCQRSDVTAPCNDGLYQCQGGFLLCISNIPPKTETCNNKDDDCDGMIDNGVQKECYTGATNPTNTSGVGICRNGKQTCTAGVWGSCQGDVVPTKEICNGKDDDCDGTVDEEPNGSLCQTHFACLNGGCVCDPKSAAVCGGTCLDVTSNDQHCGKCNNVCKNGLFCFQSKCTDSWMQGATFHSWHGLYLLGGKILTSAVDAKGNVFVAGRFEISATFGSTTISTPNFDGEYSAFLAKISPKGQWLWAKRIVNSTRDEVRGLTVDSTGNVYLTGYFAGTATFGTTTLKSVVNSIGIFVAKADNNGNWKWAIHGTVGMGFDIAFRNNQVYVTGFYKSGKFGSVMPIETGGPSSRSSLFVAKVDPVLMKWVWVRGVAASYGWKVGVDGNNNAYVLASSSESTLFGSIAVTQKQYAVAKIDSSGKWLWVKELPFPGLEKMVVDDAGNSYVTGHSGGTFSYNGQVINPSGSQTVYIAKVNTSGTLAWWKYIGNSSQPGNDVYLGGITTTSKGIYLAGFLFQSNAEIDNISLKFVNGHYFLLNIDKQDKITLASQNNLGGAVVELSSNANQLVSISGGNSSIPKTSYMQVWSYPAP
tara:strand:- start:2616 stop:5045 length:2430 start_codon:yes stop_codon:yes gene_type:complete